MQITITDKAEIAKGRRIRKRLGIMIGASWVMIYVIAGMLTVCADRLFGRLSGIGAGLILYSLCRYFLPRTLGTMFDELDYFYPPDVYGTNPTKDKEVRHE